jgi:MFS family permease
MEVKIEIKLNQWYRFITQQVEVVYINDMPKSTRTRIFIFLLLANLFLNYDTGVIPASLLEILKEIELDFKEQALLGSLVYLGLSFASLFVTPVFTKFGASKVISVVLIMNAACCFIFSISYYKPILFTTRFMMGVTEAFIVIYAPVWVNNYAPEEHSAKWMGIMHACTALGVIIGYIVAGVTINFVSFLGWRFAIQIQGIIEIPIALYFYFENEKYINVEVNNTMPDSEVFNSEDFRTPNKESSKRMNNRIDAVETSNLARYCKQTKVNFSNLVSHH